MFREIFWWYFLNIANVSALYLKQPYTELDYFLTKSGAPTMNGGKWRGGEVEGEWSASNRWSLPSCKISFSKIFTSQLWFLLLAALTLPPKEGVDFQDSWEKSVLCHKDTGKNPALDMVWPNGPLPPPSPSQTTRRFLGDAITDQIPQPANWPTSSNLGATGGLFQTPQRHHLVAKTRICCQAHWKQRDQTSQLAWI